jgi:ferredoxin
LHLDLCQGHGRCALEAPQIFDVGDLGKAVLLKSGELGADEVVLLKNAVLACPESAIAESAPD